MACKTYDKLCRWTLIYILTLESTIDLGIEKTLQAIHRIDIGRWERRQVSNYKTWLSTKWFILEFSEIYQKEGSLRYRINTQITIQMSKYPMGQIHTELVFSIFFGNRSNLELCSFSYQKYYDTLSISKYNFFLYLIRNM